VLSSDEAHVVLDRRREERRRRLEPRVSDQRRAGRRGRPGGEEDEFGPVRLSTFDHGSATRILYVISPTAPERYQFVRRHFADEPDVEVVYDRRRRERRMNQAPTAAGRRRGDRRQNDIDEDLRAVGWALIHPRDAG
jgi:hypothetical protein